MTTPNLEGIPEAAGHPGIDTGGLNLNGIPAEDNTLADNYALAKKVGGDLAAKTLVPQKARVLSENPDFDVFKDTHPLTATYLRSPRNMALAQDDLDNLAAHEPLGQKIITSDMMVRSFVERARKDILYGPRPPDVDSMTGALQYGFEGSAFNLIAQGYPEANMPKDAPLLYKLAAQVGGLAGDFPFMVAGGAAGATAGAAAGGPVGAVLGGGAGAFAFPAAIKTAIHDAQERGDIKTVRELLTRAYRIAKESAKQGAVGAITSGVGAAAKPFGTVIGLGAEVGAMTTAGAAVDGRLPKFDEFVENTIMVSGLYGARHVWGIMTEDARVDRAKTLAELDTLSKGSKLRARDPDGYARHLDTIMKPVIVNRDAFNALFQDAGPERVAAELGISESYKEAQRTRLGITVPMGKFQSAEMDTHRAKLVDDIKYSHDDLTTNEAKEIKEEQKARAKESQAGIVAEGKKLAEDSPEMQAGYDKVYIETKKQLQADGAPKDMAPDEFAKLVDFSSAVNASRWLTYAKNQGKTVDEVWKGGASIAPGTEKAGGMEQGRVPETPEFKAWFGESKVVDEKGKPQVVYHGTSDNFENFLHDGPFKKDQGWLGKGNYFTTSAETASSYSNLKGGYAGPNVKPVYLSIKNPYEATLREKGIGQMQALRGDKEAPQRTRQELIDAGFDGVVLHYLGNDGKIRESEYVAFHPEQIKSSIGNRGTFDPKDPNILRQDARARYLPDERVIEMFKSKDPTSFMHESSHDWLETMFKDVRAGEASAGVLSDWKVAADFLGVKEDQAKLTPEQHEKFADAWEQYLSEGKAPTKELQPIFEKFKEWMLKVYGDAKQALGANLNDEMRGFFDRQLATKVEIEQARQESGLGDKKIPIKDEALRAKHKTLSEKAKAKAEEMLLKPQMEELTEKARAAREADRGRIEQEVKNQVNQEPLFKSMDLLRESNLIGGKKTDAYEQASRYLGLINRPLAEAETQAFDMIAEMSGYSSGDHMAREIMTTDKTDAFNAEVKKRVNARMAAEHPDLRNSPEARQKALEAVHSEQFMDLIAMEQHLLNLMLMEKDEAAGAAKARKAEASIMADIAKETARDTIANTPVKDLNFRKYITAERNAAVRADKFTRSGDIEEAVKAKNEQLNAHALATEALKSRERINRWTRQLHDVQFSDPKAFKSAEHWNQAASLLSRFGLTPKDWNSADVQETLGQWAKRMGEKTDTVDIPDWLQNERIQKDYKDLRIGELEDLKNAIKNIKHVANFEDLAYTIFDKADLRDVVVGKMLPRFRDGMVELERKSRERGASLVEDWPRKALHAYDAVFWNSWLVAPESQMRMMDGFQKFGPWWKALYEKYDSGMNERGTRMMDAAEKYKTVLEPYSKKELKDMKSKKILVSEFGDSYTKNEIMMMLMNAGNDGNISVLINGRGWGDKLGEMAQGTGRKPGEQLRLVLEKYLDKRDFDTVQKTWDWVGSYWPEISGLYEELTGFKPKRVEPTPFKSLYGEYAGGYFPLFSDPSYSLRALEGASADAALNEAPTAAWRASTKNGFTKERQSGAKYVVSLDHSNIQRHVTDVIHDLSMRKWVLDSQRVLSYPEVQSAFREGIGDAGLLKMRQWVRDVAGQNGQRPTDLDTIANGFSKRVVISGLAARFGVLFSQVDNITGATTADPATFGWKEVTASLTGAYGNMIREPKSFGKMVDFVKETSPYMREKWAEAMDRDVRGASKRAWGEDDKVSDFALSYMSIFDKFTTAPIWAEAFKKGLELNEGSKEKAVQYADDILRRSQPGGRHGDLPPIMRGDAGTAGKLVTIFYRALNVHYNIWAERVAQTRSAEDIPAFLSTAAAMIVIPGLVRNVGRLGLPDDSTKMKKWAKEFATYPFQMFPVVRNIADAAFDKAAGIPGGDFELTPAEGPIKAQLNALGTILSKKATTQDKLEAMTRAAAMALPYPDAFNGWFWNTVDYVHKGMVPRPRDILQRRPRRERR